MFQILVAEDDTNTRKLMAAVLTRYGYEPVLACDGREALEVLDKKHIDLIILDVMMPRMDGFSVLAQMRADGNETPVLFLTAKDSVPDRVHGLDAGADDYLVKPFSFDELLARLSATRGVVKAEVLAG